MSNSRNRLAGRISTGLLGLALGLWASAAQAATVAQFSLATVGGASSTINVGQTLNLELWVNLAGDPLPGDVMGYSFYLRPSADNVITFNTSSVASAISAFQPLSAYGNNSPKTGEFDRAMGSSALPPVGVPFVVGTPRLLATFSINGLNPGTVNYTFASDEPRRTWSFNYEDPENPGWPASTEVSAADPAMIITVTPEPGIAAMMLIALVLVGKRTGRSLA